LWAEHKLLERGQIARLLVNAAAQFVDSFPGEKGVFSGFALSIPQNDSRVPKSFLGLPVVRLEPRILIYICVAQILASFSSPVRGALPSFRHVCSIAQIRKCHRSAGEAAMPRNPLKLG
jgi:hypothetical protein